MARIEYQTLVYANACSEQRQHFANLFGDGYNVAVYAEDEDHDVNFGVEVDLELCEQFADIFDWSWAADEFFTGTLYTDYRDAQSQAYLIWDDEHDAALKDFQLAADDANKAHMSANDALIGKYGDVYWDGVAEADRAYNEAVKPFRKVEREAQDAARMKYRLAQARAFFEQWTKLHEPQALVDTDAKDTADVG